MSGDRLRELPGPSLASFEKELLLCELCPRMCRHACPVGVVSRDEARSAQEKMGEARRLLRGASEPGVHTAWDCLGCGLCSATCEHDNPVGEVLFAARARRFAAGEAPEGATELARRFRESGNGRGAIPPGQLDAIPADRRVQQPVRGFEGPHAPERGVRLLFPGCELVREAPERVPELLALADALGEADLVVWDGEIPCCGYPLLAAGDAEGFAAHARKLAGALRGATLLTTPCAHCAWTLKVAFERFDVDVPGLTVEHASQTFAAALSRQRALPLPPAGSGEAEATEYVLHEPCYLSHGLGETQAPRRILEGLTGTLGNDPGEAAAPPATAWTGERTWCCGGGGGLPETRPELARELARVRAADLTGGSFGVPADAASGAATVVTASPCCESHFREAGVPTEDLFGLLRRFVEAAGRGSERPGEDEG